jgi:hypothetical protein
MVAGMQVHSGAGILTLDGGDFDGDASKVLHPANVVVEERRTKAANSETLASSTFAPRSGRPIRPMRCQSWVGKLLDVLIEWDTHSENVRETSKEKVSHLISSALIVGRSALSVGIITAIGIGKAADLMFAPAAAAASLDGLQSRSALSGALHSAQSSG